MFDEWLESLKDKLVDFAREKGTIAAQDVADRFKISKRAAKVLLKYVQYKGRVKSSGYEPA